jgi:protein Mpv17
MRVLRYYRRLLMKYPYTMQSVQTGALLCIGDGLSQTLEGIKPYNKLRNLRFTSLGAVIGPTVHAWYKFLDKKIHKEVGWRRGIIKVFFDQLIFAPLSLLVFISVISLMEGMDHQQIQEKLNTHYFDILIANYKVWPAVQFFNFTVIPLNYRVLFVQSLSIIWNTYLSWKIHN